MMMTSGLKSLYYNPSEPASYGGVERLYRQARQLNPQITRKTVKDWLSGELTYTLHKPVRYRFPRNRVYVADKDDQWQADLADMKSISRRNRGYSYLLTVIDVFSKYAWVRPLKTKKPVEVIAAFKDIFAEGRRPTALQTDRGTEFKNRFFINFLRDEQIQFFTSKNQTTKCAVVERFNRTLKGRLYRYFTAKGTNTWIDVLQEVVDSYNQSIHRSIKMAPTAVTDDNTSLVHRNLYGVSSLGELFPVKKKQDLTEPVFGDKVRLNKLAHPFRKGYLPNWSEQTFEVVSSENKPNRLMYKVRDPGGQVYEPSLYREEVQVVKETPETTYRVEKIMRKKVVDGATFYRIKWEGLPSTFNSWEPAENVSYLKDLNN
jgi:transposase InsO family protein